MINVINTVLSIQKNFQKKNQIIVKRIFNIKRINNFKIYKLISLKKTFFKVYQEPKIWILKQQIQTVSMKLVNVQQLWQKDIDETERLNIELQQIKLSFKKIFLPEFEMLSSIFKALQNGLTEELLKKKIILKLKLYSVKSHCKLIQKVAKANIKIVKENQKKSCFLICKNDGINLKVSFPPNQEYQILGKIFIYEKKSQKEKQILQKIPKQYVGAFTINLLECSKQIVNESFPKNSSNPENLNLIKKIPLHFSKLKSQSNQTSCFSSSIMSNFKKSEDSIFNESNSFIHQFSPQNNKNQHQIKDKPYIQLKFVLFQNNQKQFANPVQNRNIVTNQRNQKLKIISKTFNQKINGKSIQMHEQKAQIIIYGPSKIKISNQNRFQRIIERSKSQIVFKKFYQNSNTQNQVQCTLESAEKKLSFKDKIYQLLRQVRDLKRNQQAENQNLTKKNCRISQRAIFSHRSNGNVNSQYSNPMIFINSPFRPQLGKLINSVTSPAQQISTQNRIKNNSKKKGELISDSLIIQSKISQQNLSESVLKSVDSKDLIDGIINKNKYMLIERVQKRLQSYQKVKSLSKQNSAKSLLLIDNQQI